MSEVGLGQALAGVRALKRLLAKMVPGAAIVLGHWANRSATRDSPTVRWLAIAP